MSWIADNYTQSVDVKKFVDIIMTPKSSQSQRVKSYQALNSELLITLNKSRKSNYCILPQNYHEITTVTASLFFEYSFA
ncbi:hypothetical protein VIBNISOn1_1600010 [Vibrio nigripulchritudo SOn1]|uniref:Uncharacterized protein n=1 Tax=Vibrio nigripulchritudo SOn1 TaxID=1238450 RepID=A0AAV2VNB5_9VIBR|nr:hypothetical protein VIBNISOn1_1600010 [Vibrio nigripulchritudo SOn1]